MQIDIREKLEMELNELLTTGRLEIAKKIKEARLNGKDLSENTEYDAAVKERRQMENRIDELKEILKN